MVTLVIGFCKKVIEYYTFMKNYYPWNGRVNSNSLFLFTAEDNWRIIEPSDGTYMYL